MTALRLILHFLAFCIPLPCHVTPHSGCFFGSLHPAHHGSADKDLGLAPQEEQAGRIDNELAVVLSSIAVACKQIASMVNRAGISNLTGAAGAQNISGEDQKKLDIVSNEVFSNCLRASGRTVRAADT